MRDQSRDERLQESSIPSYMSFSPTEMGDMFSSFANIFKSVWSSIKLLKSTLMLNLKTVIYTAFNDKKFLEEARKTFNEARAQYDKETAQNLTYFKKYYVDSRTDTLWGTGPAIMAFATNPLAFIAARGPANSADTEPLKPAQEKKPADKKPEEQKKSAKISDRVRSAMEAFEFNQNLSEAAPTPSAQPRPVTTGAQTKNPPSPEDKQKEADIEKLQDIARGNLEQERKHVGEILKQLGGRPAVIKMIVDAKNFDDMTKAAAAGEKIKMGLSSKSFSTAASKMRTDLQAQQKKDPEKFKESVDEMRKKMPSITEKDDIDATLQFAFLTAKQGIQKQAVKAYNDLVQGAMETMQLPIAPEVRQVLTKSELGREYVSLMDDFMSKLGSGQQEVSALSRKSV